jgi:anaerobic magnesium-protoporphyrin IX monomethyl ester cyclase
MRVMVVDLNNFSHYPTMSVGLIVALLREAGIAVDVLSPLARGVRGYPRLTRARPWGLLDERLRYWSAVTPSRNVRRLRRCAARLLQPGASEDQATVLAYAEEMLDRRPDAVLVSTYTMYEQMTAALGQACQARGVPMLVGGNYFVAAPIVERWLRIDGVSAVYGGEPEAELVNLVRDLAAGADLSRYLGVSVPGRPAVVPAAPLQQLDRLPFADYRDFPWHRYRNRIVPLMTGRGCGWGRCRFCADVVTSAGRSFRSRSLAHVMDELRFQSERHAASRFVFLDLKLNSNLELWRGLTATLPEVLPGAAWTASVHVDQHGDHGLDPADLRQARRAGLRRITTGLETASPGLVKRMAKGTGPERTADFIRAAAEAGISVRLTTIVGYPGEEPGDVDETARFLDTHARWIDRVMLNRFVMMLGAEVDRRSVELPGSLPGLRRGELDPLNAIVGHENELWSRPAHRAAVYRLMAAVHRINRKRLGTTALEFEGVM